MRELQTQNDLKGAIAASWQRCELTHKLDRNAARPILRLQSSEIAPRLEELVARTGGRQGVFRQLAELAITAGHCLVITDAGGIVLRIEAPGAVPDWNGIALGSVWDERVAGTNGVSMALGQGRDVTVRGRDHFLHPASKLYLQRGAVARRA